MPSVAPLHAQRVVPQAVLLDVIQTAVNHAETLVSVKSLKTHCLSILVMKISKFVLRKNAEFFMDISSIVVMMECLEMFRLWDLCEQRIKKELNWSPSRKFVLKRILVFIKEVSV